MKLSIENRKCIHNCTCFPDDGKFCTGKVTLIILLRKENTWAREIGHG